jgi:ribosome-associated toxin RatA of RatAB toxin-antitoxin module
MRTSIDIEIDAPARLVFDLAHRVDRWERLLPHYARSRVVELRGDGTRVVSFVARRPLLGWLGLGLPVFWRARTWNEPKDLRLRFLHLAGVTRGMDVTWRIVAAGTGCIVTIEHDFDPRVPGLAGVVDRWFTRAIAGQTLATFKALAEAVAEGVVEPARESDPAPQTNP